MKRSRHSEEQIIAILKEQKAGSTTANVCRKSALAARLAHPTSIHCDKTVRGATLHRRLRAADRRHHRPGGHQQPPDSSRRWIKLGATSLKAIAAKKW